MPSTIVLTQNDIQNSDNNVLEYSLPTGAQFDNHEVCVESVALNYSWPNINGTTLNNDVFQYQWTVGSTTTTHTVTLPEGLYELADINAYLQYVFIINGHYLKDADDNNVFYAEFLVNANTYKFDLVTYPVPTSLPTGFSQPTANSAAGAAAWVGYPTTTFNPNIKILSTNNFNAIIGFAQGFESGLRSGTGTNHTSSSTAAPQIHPNSNVFISLDNIQNKYAKPSTIIHNLVANTGFGSKIIDRPNEFAFNTLTKGQYNRLRVSILGTDLRPLKILDPDIVIVLLIRNKDDS